LAKNTVNEGLEDEKYIEMRWMSLKEKKFMG
jgi:hypothetical protein